MHALFVTLPLYSHLRGFQALARAWTDRGHRASFLVLPGGPPMPGFDALTLPGPSVAPPPGNVLALARHGARQTERLCRDGLPMARSLGVDVVLGDQMEPASGLIARALGVPLASVACALPMDPEPGVPLPFLSWPYDPSARGLKRQRAAGAVAGLLMTPQDRVVARISREWGLGDLRSLADCLSPRLTLAQMIPGFDYPRPAVGWRIAELGTFAPPDPAQGFPPDIRPDPGRPLVYVSLGTIMGRRSGVLARIVAACRECGAQVLVSHGGCLDGAQAAAIPADWVRDFVPQRAVLARADLCVTHAGLNTVLECLGAGLPMLALPLAYDQPGVAARIRHHGLGSVLGPLQRGRRPVAQAVAALLADPGPRARLRPFAARAATAPGAAGAVPLVEALVAGSR